MYLVPMEIPEHCNNCPFGICNYNHPSWGISIAKEERNKVDGKHDTEGTYGYVCNVEFQKNGRYTKVLRANIGEDIEKPKWCGLINQQARKPELNNMTAICPECGQAISWEEDGGKDMNKLRKCKGKSKIYENGKWHSMKFELGYFHEWGRLSENYKFTIN